MAFCFPKNELAPLKLSFNWLAAGQNVAVPHSGSGSGSRT